MADDVEAWTRLSETPAYAGYVRVRRDRYRLPDGSESDWDVVEVGDTVTVVAFTRDERVVLFDQYRVGPRRVLGELPGGLIDPGEDPVAAGARELLEETGYRPGAVFDAGTEWAAANASRRKRTLIAADCDRVAEPDWGEHESGRVRTIPASELLGHLTTGDLSDGGAAVRGLQVFARAARVDEGLRRLQRLVRVILSTFPGEPETPDGPSDEPAIGEEAAGRGTDPFEDFWRRADDEQPDRLRRELAVLLEPFSAGDPVALYERASLHDFLGEEADAAPLYRRALSAGLAGDRRRACVIQLASTLRNLGEATDSLALLRTVGDDDALAPAARAFEALALFDRREHADALRAALTALAPLLPAYGRAVAAYAAELRDERPHGSA